MPLLFFYAFFWPKASDRQNRVAFDFLNIFFQSAFFKNMHKIRIKNFFATFFEKYSVLRLYFCAVRAIGESDFCNREF